MCPPPLGSSPKHKAERLLEARTPRGQTALMLAVSCGNTAFARALVKAGARTPYADHRSTVLLARPRGAFRASTNQRKRSSESGPGKPGN